MGIVTGVIYLFIAYDTYERGYADWDGNVAGSILVARYLATEGNRLFVKQYLHLLTSEFLWVSRMRVF